MLARCLHIEYIERPGNPPGTLFFLALVAVLVYLECRRDGRPMSSSPRHIKVVLMATFNDVLVSRKRSIAVIEAELGEWKSQIAGMAAGEGRAALEGIVRVKEQRLLKLRAEVVALHAVLLPDDRQVELPAAKKR